MASAAWLGAELVETRRQLEGAGAFGFGAAKVGSQMAPSRLRTRTVAEETNPVQLVSEETRVGIAKLFIALRPPPLRNQIPPQTHKVPSRRMAKVPFQ